MSAHVFFRKRDKMQACQVFLSLLRNEFYKFNNSGARVLDSIYHMTVRLLSNIIFMSLYAQRCY